MENENSEKKFVCEKCNQEFQQSSGLSRHKHTSKTCGDANKKSFQCNMCYKSFTRNDSLMKHINGGRCKTTGFPCDQCEKIFNSSWHLKRHSLVHEEKKMYDCENCKKVYSRRNLYLQHRCMKNSLHINISSLTNNPGIDDHHLVSSSETERIRECELDSENHFEDVEMADFIVEFPTMIVEDDDDKGRREDENLDGEQQQPQQTIRENEENLKGRMASDNEDYTEEEQVVPETITENEENLEGCSDSEEHMEEHMEEDQLVPETSFSDIVKELRKDAALRKRKSRIAQKVEDVITESNLDSKDDELDVMVLSLKNLNLVKGIKERFVKKNLVGKVGRKRTAFKTCSEVWQFWHENATASTITSRPAKMKINNRPKIQNGLPFIETVALVKTRNRDCYQSQWLILNKTFRQLYKECVSKLNESSSVSYGTFIALKPFYIRAASRKDFEVCCCKLHLEAKWIVDALVKLCEKQGIEVHFKRYDDFFMYLYGNCHCDEEEDKHVYINWECTPDKKSICDDIRMRWEELKETLNARANDLTTNLLCFEKVIETTRTGKEYKKLKAVTRSCKILNLLNLMEERLCKMIHHRNQLKHFRGTKKLVLDNLDAVEIAIDFSENLDKPVKSEPQSLHWTSDQVTVHSGIHFVNGEKFYHLHISDDLDHDQPFVQHVIGRIMHHVDEEVDGKIVVICSDNCSAQYKSTQNFHDLQPLSNEFEIRLVRIYGIANHGKNEVDCVGGTGKIAIRNEVVRTGIYYNSAKDCVVFLKEKFSEKRNPKYIIEEVQRDDLEALRERNRYLNCMTVDGSSRFQVIIFDPYSPTFKAAPRLCVCNLCQQDFGSCELFKTYEPMVGVLKRPALRSESASRSLEESRNDVDDFIVPGSVCAMASDSKDIESFWLVAILALKEAPSDMTDDYNRLVRKSQKFVEVNYFEKEFKSRKGHIYRKESKTAFVFKESIIYPYVNIHQANDKYILSDVDYCDILQYIQETGFSHI